MVYKRGAFIDMQLTGEIKLLRNSVNVLRRTTSLAPTAYPFVMSLRRL